MIVAQEELAHPTQPSRVRLRVFQQERAFLLTEERVGTATVFSTLGVFDEQAAAEARLRERAAELGRQRYAPAPAA
jgi:hypothetical protein